MADMAGSSSGFTRGRLEEPDHSTTNWYFTRDEIERTCPSRKDGIDLKKETYLRKSYCTFLQDLGMRLKVPQITIATAIVFCHRFFLRQSHHKNDRYMIATVCMFLAGKVEETPKPLRDVIFVSYEIRYKKDPACVQRIKQKQVFEEQKELILLGERLVLATLCFDLNIHHPYKPLVAAIKKFKVAQNALAQVAWNFVNDGLRTSLCLQFKPHHIAAGAIFLAAKFLKVKLPSEGEKVWWQEFDVTPRQLEEVSNQMLELYEQNREGPASRSSDPNTGTDVNNRDKGPSLRTANEATTNANGYLKLHQCNSPSSSVAPPEQLAPMLRREDDRVPSRHVKQLNGLVDPHNRLGPGDAPAYYSQGTEAGHSIKSSIDDFPKPTFTHENDSMLGKQEADIVGADMSLLKHADSEKDEKHPDETWISNRLKNKTEVQPSQKTGRLESVNWGAIRGQEAHEAKNYDDQLSFKVMLDGAASNRMDEYKTRIVTDCRNKEHLSGLDEVNTERVKAALEKRRRSRGGGDLRSSVTKSDLANEEELLEWELENAVETERVKLQRKENKIRALFRISGQDGMSPKFEDAIGARRERLADDNICSDKRSSKSFERGESAYGECLPGTEEDHEPHSFIGKAHVESPRTDRRNQLISSPTNKHETVSHRDAVYDSRHCHAISRDHYSHQSHHQYQDRVDGEKEQQHYKDTEWQEREYKKLRYDHGK